MKYPEETRQITSDILGIEMVSEDALNMAA